MKWIRFFHAVFLFLGVSFQAWAATEVTTISVSPNPFNPDIGEVANISVEATPGVTFLEVRVFSADQTTLIRSGLTLSEIEPGIYTTSWNARGLSSGEYSLRVFNLATTTFIGPWESVTIQGIATSITASPEPFIPTGTNATTITVQATPGQTGMFVRINTGGLWWDTCNGTLKLTETTTPGVYTVDWTAVGKYASSSCSQNPTVIWPNRVYNIYVYDSAGNQSATTGTVTVEGVNSITTSPSQFNAAGGETTTITVQGVAGLNLEARIYQDNVLLRTLSMTGSETYAAIWDGRDESGTIVPVGKYTIQLWHTGSPAPYYSMTTPVNVTISITSVTASLDPFIPTGTNANTITVQAAPGQIGMFIATSNYYSWSSCNGRLELTETTTPGIYTVDWTAVGKYASSSCSQHPTVIWPNGIYTIYVYDSAGNRSATTGTVTVLGVTSVTTSPSSFNAVGGETTTITAQGADGLNLEARIYQNEVLLRTLSMTGSGTYTAIWDGRDESGNVVPVGSYSIILWHAGSPAQYLIGTSLQVQVPVTVSFDVTSITTSLDPFIPTGTNATTITVQATPGQTGMFIRITNGSTSWDSCNGTLELTETTTPGVYTVDWTAVGKWARSQCYQYPTVIWPNGTFTIYVYDSEGNRAETTGTVTIPKVISSFITAPTQFNATGGETTTITVQGVAGLNLEARIYQDNVLLRTLSMTGSGTYSAVWDGRDESGTVVPVGKYSIQLWHAGSPAPYFSVTTPINVTIGITSVTASLDPFIPTGTNANTITVQATPGQIGMYIAVVNYYSWSSCNGSLELTETTTPGVYTVDWTAVGKWAGSQCYKYPTVIWPNGIYTIYVYDSAGNRSTTTGTVTVQSATSIATSPASFTPGGSNRLAITTNAGNGLNLEARIYNNVTKVLTRTLSMTEASGTYTTEWDGQDAYGNFAGANTYIVRIYNADSGERYQPEHSFSVNTAVFAISASPNPFVPTGSNQVTMTVLADPLQSGLKTTLVNTQGVTVLSLPLIEIGSEGTYTAVWDGKINGIIPKDGQYTIRIYDAPGNQFPATGTLTLSSARSLSVLPSPFEVTGSTEATITAEMTPGFNLEARIGNVRILPLTESAGIYTAQWDGRDDSGDLIPSGAYSVSLWNSDTDTRYDLQTSLQVTLVDTEAPETTITSGPDEASTVNTTELTFTWSGSDNLPGTLNYAFKLDDAEWTAFAANTTHTFTGLSDGPHSFSVKARDQVGNEDLSPAIRNFSVDSTSPLPASNFVASSTPTGIRLDWTHSPSTDIQSYRLYWDNGSGSINYSIPYATIYHPSNFFTASLFTAGTYRFGLRAIDEAGNEETNIDIIAEVTAVGFNLSIEIPADTYDREQSIPITGSALTANGSPLVGIAVNIDVESEGHHRQFTAYTDTSGQYRYTFQPLSNEAGSYQVTATAMNEGLEEIAVESFRLLGLMFQPSKISLNMSMNASRIVELVLSNIGDIGLTGLTISLQDQDQGDLVNGLVESAAFPTFLNAGENLTIPLVINSEAGDPPVNPVVFSLTASTAEGSTEVAVINVNLHEAVAVPVVTPDPFLAGVAPEATLTKILMVTNQGYASIVSGDLTLVDPQTFPWITVLNSELDQLQPGQSKAIQIDFSPTIDIALGNYVVQFELHYDGLILPVSMTVEVTIEETGQTAFTVYDDTGSVVSGAEVNLISKEFLVNVTPSGTQEYNNVIKGSTDSEGHLLLTDIPAGEYRYLITAAGHDPIEGEVTVEPGTTPQEISSILVTNLVNVNFTVVPTTIMDEYTVNLNITYVTNLTKPTLLAKPTRVDLSFFPEDGYEGAITITNTSNNAPVRDLMLNAAELDLTDNEIKILFANGMQTIKVNELLPQDSVSIPFTAIINNTPPAKLNSRYLGNIIVSGKYTYSIQGKAYVGTTTTPIPVFYSKPADLTLPSISYVNDETDGIPNDLEYQGSTYRLSIRSNRNMTFTPKSDPQAFADLRWLPDLQLGWSVPFNEPGPLTTKGELRTFDITDLEETLEQAMESGVYSFSDVSHVIRFAGRWQDRTENDVYQIPIGITTIREHEIVIVDPCLVCIIHDSGPGVEIPIVPTLPMNAHGEVRLQIDQSVTLEREAFNARLELTPTVAVLDNVSVTLNIVNAEDASSLFSVINTGLTLSGANLSGPTDIQWQIIPSSEAGGTDLAGLNYRVSATINYGYGDDQFSYTTQEESITVQPMPKLTLDYYLPYVVMAGEPVKIRVVASNQGAGTARNLTISSAQPRILDNENNIPISFVLNGSSATTNEIDYQNGVLAIDFGEVAPGSTAEGYWNLTTSRDGYFVDFDAALKHQSYRGVELDPLITDVNVHLVPAIGGRVTQVGCGSATLNGLKVELLRNGDLKLIETINSSQIYFLSDLEPGDGYRIDIKSLDGKLLSSIDSVTVLANQPMAIITSPIDVSDVDADIDTLPDCWETTIFGNLDNMPAGDFEGDGLTNKEEYDHGADPTERDTDGDSLSDYEEITKYHTDPTLADSDNDGLNDGEEITTGTNPRSADTDEDGMSDSYEIANGIDPLKKDAINYVALGDSFSSGEGAGSYLSETHQHDYIGIVPVIGVKDQDYNLCARSEVAYSTEAPGGHENAAILNGKDVKREFYACSGAEIENVLERCQDDEDGFCYSGERKDGKHMPDDVSQLSHLEDKRVELLTISIGGNDAGFAFVLEKCVVGVSPCEKDDVDGAPGGNPRGEENLGDWLDGKINDLQQRLLDTYQEIKLATDNKPLLVIGYPKLIENENKPCDYKGAPVLGGGGEFEIADIVFLNRAAEKINHIIKCAASEAGAYFVDIDADFSDRLCSDNSLSAINGANYSLSGLHKHESFHPNGMGHTKLANIVNKKLNSLTEGGRLPIPVTNPAPEVLPECR